jgi:hypothetical protein
LRKVRSRKISKLDSGVSKGLWGWKSRQEAGCWADLEPLVTRVRGCIVYSNFDPKALQQATRGWSQQRKQIVIDVGLAGTLELGKVKKSNRYFTEWLLKRVDIEKSELRIDERETVAILESDFGLMLGIRSGGTKTVKRGAERPSPHQIKIVCEVLGLPD